MSESDNHVSKTVKPWGERIEFARNEPCTVVLLVVNKGESLSLQTHKHREEFWYVVSGKGTVIVDGEKKPANTGDTFHVGLTETHWLEASNDESICVLEVSRGIYDDNDITRIEDNYGRETTQ